MWHKDDPLPMSIDQWRERDLPRLPTLIRFWNAITGLQFEAVSA